MTNRLNDPFGKTKYWYWDANTFDFAVFEAVSKATGIPKKAILGRSKRSEIVRARQLLCKVGVDFMGYSSSEVGRALEKDHTTVLYAIQTANAWMERSKAYYDAYEQVVEELKQHERRRQNEEHETGELQTELRELSQFGTIDGYCMDVACKAADALDARDAEIARLREVLGWIADVALGDKRDHE